MSYHNQLYMFASQSLKASKSNYIITEVETLTVLLAIIHFHFYLYDYGVTVCIDYSAVNIIVKIPK